MLTTTENFFVRLLRGTVVATAFVSFLVTVLALLYALYAQFAPEPQPQVTSAIGRLREAVDPRNLIKEVFSSDSATVKEAEVPDNITYQLRKPSPNEMFQEFNVFLNHAFGASFENANQFSDWLYGRSGIQFRWSRDIDKSTASDESNVNVLWPSLFFDYAKRLEYRAQLIASANKVKSNSAAIDRLTASTPPSHAPYFLVWFFSKLEGQLQQLDQELQDERTRRAALRLTIPLALYVAAGAFSYFIFIMFLFLLVSIEASVRLLASVVWQTPRGASAPAFGLGVNPLGSDEPS